MPTRLRALSGCLILLAIAPLEAANPAAENHSLEVLESGVAAVNFGTRGWPIAYSQTLAGPLFALQPLVSALGGELEIGPTRQRHELRIGDTAFLFGPGAVTVTEGDDIKLLTQAPVAGAGGTQVPLDFLQTFYGNLLGFDFEWRPAERQLLVARRPLRQLPVALDVVTLQGVTTLVFEFPERPRYHIKKSARAIEIELIGDRLSSSLTRPFPADQFVRNVEIGAEGIRIDLAAMAAAQDYVLENPFRIVFDVLRDPSGAAAGTPLSSPRPTGQRQGVRTVILDPGHGGADPGAKAGDGEFEKDLTLALAKRLETRLEQALNLRVVLTRDHDADLPLDSRSALANQYKGDLFISLHLNSSPNSAARGAETYFSSVDASDSEAERMAVIENAGDPLYSLHLMLWDLAQSRYLGQSQSLAGLVQAELNEELNLRNRGVKQAPFRVLLGAAMPAVLVELGFLSNPLEKAKLEDAAYRSALVEALVRAVSRYKAAIEQSSAAPAEFSTR
ncbi:MAG: N-acetylmuramoyl-L-alanine amidase [Acidobacteriota bacterium]|nr:N-acetylmuramoyl-L-alanine amidase [Acidobacteriota bacterium]